MVGVCGNAQSYANPVRPGGTLCPLDQHHVAYATQTCRACRAARLVAKGELACAFAYAFVRLRRDKLLRRDSWLPASATLRLISNGRFQVADEPRLLQQIIRRLA